MFEQFIQERVYLKGVSPKTVISYGCAFKAFAGATETKPAMMQRICELREKGISPISVNCYLRHLKAYLRWMEQEGHSKEPLKVQFPKAEQKSYPERSLHPPRNRRASNRGACTAGDFRLQANSEALAETMKADVYQSPGLQY
jgi:hypothetical protein